MQYLASVEKSTLIFETPKPFQTLHTSQRLQVDTRLRYDQARLRAKVGWRWHCGGFLSKDFGTFQLVFLDAVSKKE